jgi:hypothetical protein
MGIAAPHLSPRLIAKPLDEIRSWRLPEEGDLLALHRGVLKTLVATDSLARLELPERMRSPRLEDAREVAEWSVVSNLLEQAEGVLRGAPHRNRIARLRAVSPGHAMQLERLRAGAAAHLRRLRMRVDFVCGGKGSPAVVRSRVDSAHSAYLQ